MEWTSVVIYPQPELAQRTTPVKVLALEVQEPQWPYPSGVTMAEDTLTIEEEALAERKVIVLRLAGNVSARTFDRLESAIRQLLARGSYRLVVDLSLVGYISSSAAGVFMNALTEAHEHGGNIILLNPSPNVREILDLLNLSQIFRIVDDRESAFAAFV